MLFRRRVHEDAAEQRVHRGQAHPGGPGHGLPVDQVHQQHLGASGTQDTARESNHHGGFISYSSRLDSMKK